MWQVNKSKLINYCLLSTMFLYFGCCKTDYTYITVSNQSGKNKYYKVYAILKNSRKNIGDELKILNANEKSEIIINGYDSNELLKFDREKRIIIIFYDSKNNDSEISTESKKDSIVKNYSMKELEANNWEIEFSGN